MHRTNLLNLLEQYKPIDLTEKKHKETMISHEIPEYKSVPKHIHYDVRFLLRQSDKNETISISDESDDLKWFETPPTDNIDVNRMFEKWKKLRQ